MKQFRMILCCILYATVVMASAILLSGCSDGESAKEGSHPLEGVWMLNEMQVGEKTYSLEDFAKTMKADNVEEITLLLDVDGEGGFALYAGDTEEPVAEGQYSDAEESGYLFTVDDGKKHVSATLEEDKLVLHDTVSTVESKMIFVKNRGDE